MGSSLRIVQRVQRDILGIASVQPKRDGLKIIFFPPFLIFLVKETTIPITQ